MQNRARFCRLFFLSNVFLWVVLTEAWAQSPSTGMRPGPISPDSPSVNRGSDPLSNEEALDLPENPEWLSTDLLDERMMQFDEIQPVNVSVNLCGSTWDELVGTGILTTLQASSFIAFRQFYGCPTAWYELQAVPGFDTTLIRLLRNSTSLESNSTFHSLGYSLTHARVSLMLRSTRNIPGLRAYQAGSGDNAGLTAYRGGPQTHLWQLRHTGYRHQMVLSLPKSQGAYGMGRLGGGMMLTSDSRQRQMAGIGVGDYHLRLGLGLSWNTCMFGSLTSGIMGLRWMGQSVSVASGAATSANLKGLTAYQHLKNGTRILIWAALQRPDARIEYGVDSNQAFIISLPAVGMARTQTEWLGRRGSLFKTIGISAMNEYKDIKILIYSSLYKYDMPFLPKTFPWPAGTAPPERNGLSGLSHNATGKRWEWSGELALNSANGLSVLQQLILTPHSRWQTAWIGRHYGSGHSPPFAGALGRQSTSVNEQGFSWMIQWMGKGRGRVLGLADTYRHPLPRFGSPLPSYGYRIHLRGEWWPNRDHLLYCRLDLRKEWGGQNKGQMLPAPYFAGQNSWVLGWNYQARQNPLRECRVRLDGQTKITERPIPTLPSVALSARIRWVVGSWRFSMQQAWVHTTEGTGPIYFFEPAPRFASGIMSVSGRAARQVFLAECRLSSDLRAWIRVDRTRYFDRERAGSGWETTSGPFRATCTLQLLYNLAGPRTFIHEKIDRWHENPRPEPNGDVPANPK